MLPRPAWCSPRALTVWLAAAAAAWLLLLAAAPYLVSHNAPEGVLFKAGGIVYLAGHVVCHQRASRSFHAWGVQLPVCARCTGLYASVLLGSLFAMRRARPGPERPGPKPGTLPKWRGRLALAAAPTAASVGLEASGLWAQSPAIRAAAAVPLGFVVAWFVGEHAVDVAMAIRRRGCEARPFIR